jgi:hypothetical protein
VSLLSHLRDRSDQWQTAVDIPQEERGNIMFEWRLKASPDECRELFLNPIDLDGEDEGAGETELLFLICELGWDAGCSVRSRNDRNANYWWRILTPTINKALDEINEPLSALDIRREKEILRAEQEWVA